MSDDKKLSLSGRSTLGLGKGVEKGKVRQSFSHGRSKAVVVERRRKRLLKKDSAAQEPAEETKQEEAPSFAPKRPDEDTDGHLTRDELQARAEALRHAEEDRRRQAEEEERRRQAEEEERRRKAEEEAMREATEESGGSEETAPAEAPGAPEGEQVSEEERLQAAEEEARKLAEETAKRQAQEKVRRKAEAEARQRETEEEERRKAEEEAAERKKKEAEESESTVKYGFDSTRERELEEERAREEKKRAAKPSRRDESRRRSGKLTIAKALEEGGEEEKRQRSLAAYRRAQAKKKAARESGDGDAQTRKMREVTIPEVITVQELANRMAEKAADVIKALMKMDVMATINDNLDQDTAELIVAEFGHKAKRVSESDVEIGLTGTEDPEEAKQPRPPVVTVMGHVDHGKTSLLDALRETDVAAGEAGGITQHIGAYQLRLSGGDRITFIDTPGHAAFTEMRARGASVTDLVVLVVAADDGVMPQTIEAINHAKAAEVPIIVAINKSDVTGADPDRIRQELLQHEVVVESMSGDVLDVEVSALKRTGLDKLEEAILLQAELLELKANPKRPAEGVIVEAKLEKGRGPVATVLINRGTLKVGDIFVAGAEWGRVRALMDERAQQLDEAGPARPVEVLGLQGAPSAGDDFAVVENEARAREVSEYRQSQLRQKRQGGTPSSLESMFSAMKEKQAQEFPVLIKGDVQGSVEAIVSALEKIGNEDIRAHVLHAAVGGVTETDVTLAKASDAVIIGFNVRANRQAREAAEQEGVTIEYYSVIYNLVDDVKAAMAGELGPEIRENTIGTAEVREVFAAGKAGKAAGCLVVDGVIRANGKARLLRDDVVVYDGEINSLRRFRDEVSEVASGTECGISFERFSDIKAGDVVECYELEEHKREL